jgi:hypothetical protein
MTFHFKRSRAAQQSYSPELVASEEKGRGPFNSVKKGSVPFFMQTIWQLPKMFTVEHCHRPICCFKIINQTSIQCNASTYAIPCTIWFKIWAIGK